jgi:hypothetical protein
MMVMTESVRVLSSMIPGLRWNKLEILTTKIENFCVVGMNLFVGKEEQDQFSLVVNGEELIVVFVKKRGTASDNRTVDFQPKNAMFKQGCGGGRKALEQQGDTMVGNESKGCLMGEDHHKGKGTVRPFSTMTIFGTF